MKLVDQVISLELAKKLKELGFKQESLFYWNLSNQKGRIWQSNFSMRQYGIDDLIDREIKEGLVVSAYTAAELGEMLPKRIQQFYLIIEIDALDMLWSVGYMDDEYNQHPLWSGSGKTEADARAKMLIFLKEKGLI